MSRRCRLELKQGAPRGLLRIVRMAEAICQDGTSIVKMGRTTSRLDSFSWKAPAAASGSPRRSGINNKEESSRPSPELFARQDTICIIRGFGGVVVSSFATGPVSSCTKRRPPTPFDINQLHLIVALSRRRPRVRVPSLPSVFRWQRMKPRHPRIVE